MKLFIVAIVVLLLAETTFALWVRADVRVDLKKKKRLVSDPELEERDAGVHLTDFTPEKLSLLKKDLKEKITDLLKREQHKFGIQV